MDEEHKVFDVEVLKPKELTKHHDIVKQGLRKYLDKEIITERLAKIQDSRVRMVITTLWMTGLRVSEVIGIRKGNLDFTNKTLVVRWQKNRRYYERVIPMHPELCTLLQLYSAPMLTDTQLFPYTREWVTTLCRKHLGCSAHALRHSFAVNFLRQSKSASSLVILQKLLGHANIQTTMVYLSIVPSDIALELEKVSFR